MVVDEQTKKRVITADDETDEKVQNAFMWCCDGGVAKLATDWRQTGDAWSLVGSKNTPAVVASRTFETFLKNYFKKGLKWGQIQRLYGLFLT